MILAVWKFRQSELTVKLVSMVTIFFAVTVRRFERQEKRPEILIVYLRKTQI